MLKIEVIDWPEFKKNNQYIFINPNFITYIMPYSDKQDKLYELVMSNTNSFLISQSSLDKILKYEETIKWK